MKTICHFVSTMDYDLLINGEYIGRCSEDSIDVVLTNPDVSIMCVPLEGGYSIVSGRVRILNGNISVNNRNVMPTPMGRGHWQIDITFARVFEAEECKIISTAASGKMSTCIYNNPNGVIDVYVGSALTLRKNCDKILAADVDIESGCNVIKCQLIDNKYYVIVIDDNGNVLFNTICNSYEVVDDSIKTMSEVCDIAGHGIVRNYSISTHKVEEYVVYVAEIGYANNDRLLPLALLQNIKVGDYKLAKSYLCDAMQNIQDCQLKQYFGDYDRIIYNRYLADGTINYSICQGERVRNYDFVIKAGRIEDIIEVAL